MQLDTHVVAWLYAGRLDLLPPHARELLESEALEISPMVELELTYLHEVGRTAATAATVLSGLRATVGLAVSTAPLSAVAHAATSLSWTRDPFDRIISAQAKVTGQPLLTRDRVIREHLDLARWDG